jgi:hypothetical protein
MASASTPLRAPRTAPAEAGPAEEAAWDDLSPEEMEELREACARAREEERIGQLEEPVQL